MFLSNTYDSSSFPLSLYPGQFSNYDDRKIKYSNRFIPLRPGDEKKREIAQIKFEMDKSITPNPYSNQLAKSITGFGLEALSKQPLLEYSSKTKRESVREKEEISHPKLKVEKSISDVPKLREDYYLKLIDLSKNKSKLAVAVDHNIFLYNLDAQKVSRLTNQNNEAIEDKVSNVCWLSGANENLLAVGRDSGYLEIWNTNKGSYEKLRAIKIKEACLGSIVEVDNNCLAVGSDDESVSIINLMKPDDEALVGQILGKAGAVCGIAVSLTNEFMAVGGNVGKIEVWRSADSGVDCYETKLVAIKALAWNYSAKRSNLLVAGGKIADRTKNDEEGMITLWDAKAGVELFSVRTPEQVTNLHWLSDGKHLISTHGSPSNQIRLWHDSVTEGVHCLKEVPLKKRGGVAHNNPILYSALSSDGTLLFTYSRGTLKSWRIMKNYPKIDSLSLKAFSQYSTIR